MMPWERRRYVVAKENEFEVMEGSREAQTPRPFQHVCVDVAYNLSRTACEYSRVIQSGHRAVRGDEGAERIQPCCPRIDLIVGRGSIVDSGLSSGIDVVGGSCGAGESNVERCLNAEAILVRSVTYEAP
jgi:hypothetical protein